MKRFNRTQRRLLTAILVILTAGSVMMALRQAPVSNAGYSAWAYIRYGLVDRPLTSLGNMFRDVAGLWSVYQDNVYLNEELASLFARALEVAEADKTAAQQYLSGIVLHIMGAVLAISQNKRYEVDNAAQKIESAKIIMHENVYKDIDPEELAMKLGISYSWFRKVFKEYTGYAPAKYFQELKLRKAKQLLIESSMSVKEICYELNYTSTEHFFSVFKKRTNFTPTEYRNFGRGGKEKENENE